MPVNSLEALELVNCHHEGLASLSTLGTQFYAYSLLRNWENWHNKNASHQQDSLAPAMSRE